jgi:hypothetical protein
MKDSTINYAFDLCVLALVKSAELIGMTYKEINVWIFCIIGPIAFILLVIALMRQIRLTRKFESLYIRSKDHGHLNSKN